jgi:hypothetical protein
VRWAPVHPPVERHHFAYTRRFARHDPGICRIVDLLKDTAIRILREPSPAVATQSSAEAK